MTVKFTFQWFLLLIVGVTTIYVLVQNAYEPAATTAATALAFGFAPLVAGVVLFNLWDGRQKIYWATLMLCLFEMFLTTLLN